jgi:hypothetical protein
MNLLKKRNVSSAKLICWFLLALSLGISSRAAYAASSAVDNNGTVTLMTRNLYVGAAFDPLLNATTPNEIPERVSEIYTAILSSQFPCRAEAIADEIVQNQPDLVGIQEAELLRVYSPCGFSTSNTPQPTAFAIDHVQILIDALDRRGARYAIAASVTNTDVTVTSVTGDTIRLTDRDIIMVRTDALETKFSVSNPKAGNFNARLTVQIGGTGGPSLAVLRGWCSVDVKVRGKLVRIVNTHLEDSVPLIQSAQADELLRGPLRTSRPVIAIGDFNASSNSVTYGKFSHAGFHDSWALANPGDPGFSCCQAADLLNPISQLSARIDLILFHGGRIHMEDAARIGADPADRIPSGQWPSDHAGVVVTLDIK